VGREAFAPGGTVQGMAFGGAKIWNSEILHPQLSIYFTVHTIAIVVTIRITIGDLIAGVGAATKTFAPGCKHPRTVRMFEEKCGEEKWMNFCETVN